MFVFSSGSYLATDVYSPAVTSDQLSDMGMDIPGDFRFPGNDFVRVRVPTGAPAILVSVNDSAFVSNKDSDGDWGVTIDSKSDGMVNGSVFVLRFWIHPCVRGQSVLVN